MTPIQRAAKRATEKIVPTVNGPEKEVWNRILMRERKTIAGIIEKEFEPFEQAVDALVMAHGYIAVIDAKYPRLKPSETWKAIEKALAEIERIK